MSSQLPVAPKKPTSRSSSRSAAKSSAASAAHEYQIVFDSTTDRTELAQRALANQTIMDALVENLSGEQRRVRQFSASTLNLVSAIEPGRLVSHIPELVDALYRPEAQTRWECLEVLARVVVFDPDSCDDAIIGTEASLYDEDSGLAHLAAVRFLCAYGALNPKRANVVWPFIEEAIQCYHGDPEFQDMLISVTQFATGKIGTAVKRSLSGRMEFDAKNSKGLIGRRAQAIIEICSEK